MSPPDESHTITIRGTLDVTTGNYNFPPYCFISLPTGASATLAKVKHILNAGSCVFDVVRATPSGYQTVPGYASIASGTAAATTTGGAVVNDGEGYSIRITSITGAKNLSATLTFRYS